MKTHTLGAGQFVDFILTSEWSEAMKMMWTAEIQILNSVVHIIFNEYCVV